MYTDTSRPNHLAMEVIDNSIDEALAGYARVVSVTVFKDGSVEVMPTMAGVCRSIFTLNTTCQASELILTKPACRR